MRNEWGYIDNKPFKEYNSDKQRYVIINIDDEGIEFKTMFQGKDFYKLKNNELNEIYAVDSHFNAITALGLKNMKYNGGYIESTTLRYNSYLKECKKRKREIEHFTTETKIKEIEYYSDSIREVFKKRDMIKVEREKDALEIKITKSQKKEIAKIKCGRENEIGVFLKADTVESHEFNEEKYIIQSNLYLVLSFKNGIVFEEAEKYIFLLDYIMYLLSGNISRHTKIILENLTKNSYIYNDKKEDIQSKGRSKFINIIGEKDLNIIFTNLLKKMIRMYDEENNVIRAFIEFNIPSILEIKFLEYYKALEYIKSKEKLNKKKDKPFLLSILKKYDALRKKYFGDQEEEKIEEEIRSLRNYYTHTGYYIEEDKLPIPNYKPKRYKKVNIKWLYNVLYYIIDATESELLNLCGINLIRVDDNRRKLELIIKEEN